MRWLAAALLLLPLAAVAQSSATVDPSPPDQPAQEPPTPDQAVPDQPQADQAPAAPDQAPSWPNGWEKRGGAQVAALDKLSAQPTTLVIAAGGSAPFHTLTIAVRSCLVRPPGQPADATAWLDVTDGQPGGAEFHGWMLANEPGLAVLPSPLYDVRLLGCR